MTDRELLELAAKASGMRLLLSLGFTAGDEAFFDEETRREWNPLTDDGDALRLLVRLELELAPLEGGGVDIGTTTEAEPFGVLLASECGPDAYAATRRAIVRAAAEIGKARAG